MSSLALSWPGLSPSSGRASTVAEDFAPYLRSGSTSAMRLPEFKRLDRLAMLQPNWDDRGSKPPTQRALLAARLFWLPSLFEAVASTGRPWVVPHITASGSGEVAFEWWHGDRKVTLYFGDGTAEFLKVWGPHIEDDMESGNLDSVDAFRALWVWLIAA